MEQKMQDQIEGGIHEMEYFSAIMDKLSKFCEKESIDINDISKALKLFLKNSQENSQKEYNIPITNDMFID